MQYKQKHIMYVCLHKYVYLFCSCDSCKFPTSVVFIVDKVGDILEVHEMCPDEHVPQRDKVAVLKVLDVDCTPGIFPTSGLLAVPVNDHVRANNSKRNTFLHPPVLLLVILLAVGDLGELVDLDLGPGDLVHDGLLEGGDLLGRHRVRLGQDRDDVHLVVQLLHELDVKRLQSMSCDKIKC